MFQTSLLTPVPEGEPARGSDRGLKPGPEQLAKRRPRGERAPDHWITEKPLPPAAWPFRLPRPVASGTQLRPSTAGQTRDDQGVATPSLRSARSQSGPETPWRWEAEGVLLQGDPPEWAAAQVAHVPTSPGPGGAAEGLGHHLSLHSGSGAQGPSSRPGRSRTWPVTPVPSAVGARPCPTGSF